MDKYYRRVELPSDEPIQFVGIHPLKWHRRPTHPDVGFIPLNDDPVAHLETQLKACERERNALQRRLKLEDGVELLKTVRQLAYDSGWLSAKIELGHSETPDSDELDLRTLIQRRNDAFRRLEAALTQTEEG